MAKKYYQPRTDSGKLAWLRNFNQKLPNYATLLGITAAELAMVAAAFAMFDFVMALLTAIKAFKEDVTGYKNILRSGPESVSLDVPPVFNNPGPVPATVLSGVFIRIARLALRIKSHDKYNTSIGEDLLLEGADQIIDTTNWKPIIRGKQVASKVELDWPKDDADGIDFYVDRHDDKGWIFLARDTNPGYTDTFPLPPSGQTASWDYKAIYVLDDEQVGNFSDVISVVVKGI